MTRRLYAIWYGRLLDGVTASMETANEAWENGADVLFFEAPEGEPVRWSDIPKPDGPGLPLGWQSIEPVT